METWLFEESRASVVSASQLKKLGCKIELKGDADAFVVTFPSGKVFCFAYDPVSELYMYQLSSNNNPTNLTLLATVKDNKKQFTPHQVKAAEKAQELQRRLGYLSQRQFEDVLRRKLIHNCT